jgi:hypothetical protein
MDLPIQAPPVLRGHGRHIQEQQAMNGAVAQSQLFGGQLSALCAACAIAPPPYSIICTLLCPWLLGGAKPLL